MYQHVLNRFQFGGYPPFRDEKQRLDVALDCEPFVDHVRVKFFDQSRGGVNRIVNAYAVVKVCTFGPQAHA